MKKIVSHIVAKMIHKRNTLTIFANAHDVSRILNRPMLEDILRPNRRNDVVCSTEADEDCRFI